MKTLVLGYTSYQNTNASSVLAHERSVASTFSSFGVGDVEIGMLYGNESLLTEPDVYHVWNGNSTGAGVLYPKAVYALTTYLDANPSEYDLIVFSYEVDVYYVNALSYIPTTLGIPLFMPMTNEAVSNQTANGEQAITFIGKGSDSNIGGTGTRIDCYDNKPTTSEAVPMVAGKVSKLINSGLSGANAVASLLKSCDQYPTWDSTNGYGKVPDVIPDAVDYTVASKDVTEPDAEDDVTEEDSPEDVPDNTEGAEVPIVNNPTSPTVSRSSTAVTVTANELGTTQKLYRREKPSDDWELVDTATDGALTDTVEADKNYIYSVKINNGETESDYSEPSYLAGEFYGASVGVMV